MEYEGESLAGSFWSIHKGGYDVGDVEAKEGDAEIDEEHNDCRHRFPNTVTKKIHAVTFVLNSTARSYLQSNQCVG